MTLAITAIVAATALASVAFAVPQQVMAGGHRHHNSNSIRVDQQVNQANICSTQQQPKMVEKTSFAATNATTAQDLLTNPQVPQGSNTICANEGSNSADIGHH